MLSLCFLELSVGVKVLVIGLSQISSSMSISSAIAFFYYLELAKINVFYVTYFFVLLKHCKFLYHSK